MKIKNSRFVTSASSKQSYPEADLPELAFVGRSNVGKSSLLNMLLNRKDLAKTASTPGKTRLINFFDIDGLFRIVDLPGYGYAKVSKSLQKDWAGYIEEYLNERECLLEVFLLVDARRVPNELDKMMYEYIKKNGYTGYIFVTKMDKLKQSEKKPNLDAIVKALNVGTKEFLIPVSSTKRSGKYEAWNLFNRIFSMNRLDIHIERQVKE